MKRISKQLVLVLLLASTTHHVSAQIEGAVLAIGDSLTAGEARDSRGIITCASLGGVEIARDRQRTCIGGGQRNIGGWQPELSQILGVDVFNYGNTGELTSEMVPRLNSHMARTPSQFVLILGGTNDILFGQVSQERTIENLKEMIALVRSAGREPIIGTLPPLLFGVFASRNAAVLSINDEIRSFENIQIADHYALLADDWDQNTSGDFIHLGEAGDSIVAQEWSRAINASLKARFGPILAPIVDLLLTD